jgi:PKD repeat protein
MKTMKFNFRNALLLALGVFIMVQVSCDEIADALPAISANFNQTVDAETGKVTFINTSENATIYAWDFGDNTSSELKDPVKQYSENGTYTVKLTASNGIGDEDVAQAEVVIEIVVADTEAPVITLLGDAEVTINVGDTFDDLGATATDNVDGDITDDIAVTGTVDVNAAGSYTLNYNVSDAAGNAADEVSRTVIVNEVFNCTAETSETLTATGFNWTMQTNPSANVIDDGVTFSWIDNPDFDNAVNSSCKVGQATKKGQNPWDNLQYNLANKIDFAANGGFKIKVWSGKADSKVRIKLEEVGNAGNNAELEKTMTKTSEWEELTFDFAEGQTNKFNKIVIFFDLNGNNTDTYYFDDLTLYTRTGGGGGGDGSCPAPPAGELLSNGNFESGAACWQLLDAALTTISTTVNNGGSNSGQLQGATGKAVGLKQERFATGSLEPNTTYTVSFDIIASGAFGEGGVFKAFTFSEGVDGGNVGATQHVLADGITSLSTSWERKQYTFTTPANANQVAGGFSFLVEIVNSSVKINVDNVVVKK